MRNIGKKYLKREIGLIMIWEGKRMTSSIRYHLLNIHETPLQIADLKLPILEPAPSCLECSLALLCFAK